MSLSVHPVRRLISRPITRSQSFTGVTIYDKSYRNLSVFSTPGLSRKPSRAYRIFTMSNKSNPPHKVPQPERLDQVYEALKKGLQSYLQVHQMDLDSLTRQIKQSKRNSRLGLLYELDKQVKVTERYIRRLEFHLSKIEELYEAYCLQKRLRDGANKIVRAYTSSTGSKEARESLAEANKGYKEYTENMCVLESDMENQLGDFHIKMKGLAGFARLCAGDQYEIFMKYGRQRWKLRGRIELNGKQVWDNEEMVFLPLISDFLYVKVTELKSLASHVVVGSVSCETKDLFAALPQMVAVDINDLGTIKLSLEVTWNPFDKDDMGSVASTVNKAPSVSKRFSTIFNQTPPDTPSLREQAFYSLPRSLAKQQHWPLLDIFRGTLSQSCSCNDSSPTRSFTVNMLRRREELENGTAWSNSSESSDDSSSPQLSVQGLHTTTHRKAVVVTPEIQPAVTGSSSPQPGISFYPRDPSSTLMSTDKVSTVTEVTNINKHGVKNNRDEEKRAVSVITESDSEEEIARKQSPIKTVDPLKTNSHTSRHYSRSLSHISESSADAIVVTDRLVCEFGEAMSQSSGISINDIEMEILDRTPEPQSTATTDTNMSPRRHCVIEENTKTDGVTSQHPIRKQQDTSSCVLTHCLPWTEEIQPNSVSQTNRCTHLECTPSESEDDTYVARWVPVKEEISLTGGDYLYKEGDSLVDSNLDEALGAVVSCLEDCRGQFPELQLLEHELKLLQVTLKGKHSRSPSTVSLTLETVLGSFDFLNTSDWEEEEDEEECCDKSSRHGPSIKTNERSPKEGDWSSPSFSNSLTTTGCASLDCSLLVHLKNCSSQLLRLGIFGPLRCREMYALDRLLREARVLEIIRQITKDNPQRIRQPTEVVPQLSLCLGAVSLWQRCVGQGNAYCISAESFLATLSTVYSSVLPKMTDRVCLCLVERVLGQQLSQRGSNRDRLMVTLFQLWNYLDSNGISNMEIHISELAEEVWFVQSLGSCDLDVIVHTLRHPSECSLRREGLHAVAKLLKDSHVKVSASASSVLRGLAAQPGQREQALVSCLELLEDENVDTRVCGCKALACLKAKESIDQLVYLCQTDKEEVRDAAKQTLLVLGEEGKMAHRHVETSQDSMPRLFTPGSMASTAF
ncbi:rho family-interacting cell polarization regulator 1 isoform X2 [Mugil cephalus]|nr:rho family-interacting cell polarization regulator 1 isoform X2 [Mugil cephalus]XP_047451641.1 rho family-interacting cell polarization regulator 1 isoform X2 [Mugil cephalus]